MTVSIPPSVTVIHLETAPFRNAADAKDWSLSHGIVGKMSNEDSRGKGEISISITSLEKMLSGSALRKSVTPDIHYASLMRLRDIIRESFVAEIHPDYRKIDGIRSIENGVNLMVEIAVLYGCVAVAGIPYRVKTTLKLHRDPTQPTKAYSYEISNIEVLTGTAGIVIPPNANTSMNTDILLKFVRRVNGTPYVRDYSYERQESASFVERFLSNKKNIVLVTGRSSYAACGAEAFFASFLKDKCVTHLTTAGENARAEDIEEKHALLPSKIDAFVAVGGGTVIDTTKLLRSGFPGEIAEADRQPPFLAIPTTAGTGAETTRFAVYYDHGKKMSADDIRYLPTDVILIPEFAESQSPYQQASTEFDAYAQAVESLWAKGATEESKGYARKALELMASGQQMLGSYWAGRAIDISRTTAAHAFSYFMTANYGIPHGHAVYMMFPYICRANGHPEYIKSVPELSTLDQFVAEKKLDRAALIERLFENVNPARLGNNPCPIRKEDFRK